MTASSNRIVSQAIVALTFLFSGCVYHDYPSPRIEGTLNNAGKPLPRVTVSLVEFDRHIATTQTDNNGYFSFVPQGDWHVFIPVGPQDRLSSWTLTTIDPQGQKRDIYTSQRFGGPFSGYSRSDSVKLFCELSPTSGESQNIFCEAQ
ncbi:carboxypeptidase regulatory-like domain-containing protein [Enterobacter ludwigii]|jgi:hypothetical protein|uniref:hypothetical protein n=1 Tax=Enterobacter cloacae complex TaxID=354276 RepID=UPI000911D2AE|nr:MULTISPECIES: hypothetical protein [Enterobacter cloacae complex]AWC85240.1 carboxypeptidase regulatory-like domain-containing protein [Enterobacter cloacae complex sp. FDA-CDC-AR_0164]MBG0633884.1 carboxypeptidase regulatory-like domain-containing protein [Enterobacter ludwigii]SHM37617.1 hypothetical protein SAMN05428986_2629 [Enterobacter ludwigii]